jgi:hypothetical protein
MDGFLIERAEHQLPASSLLAMAAWFDDRGSNSMVSPTLIRALRSRVRITIARGLYTGGNGYGRARP